MDVSSAFKSEVFRPLATVLLPGAIAIAPYVLLVNFYNPPIERFWHDYPGLFSAITIGAALSVGMILENLGSRIESELWDVLVSKETDCHQEDWYRFLALAPTQERIGHRYLRTITLRMKFELGFGLALFVMWFGMLWLDAARTLWAYDTVILLSAIVLALSAYLLWESLGSVWLLGILRHLILNDAPCYPVERPADKSPWRERFDRSLLGVGFSSTVWGILLIGMAINSERHIGKDSGLISGIFFILFGAVMVRGWWHLQTDSLAEGRRRGMSLRLSLAFSLLAAFLTARAMLSSPPLAWSSVNGALMLCVAYLFFARVFWLHTTELPPATIHELPSPAS
jgi:hypothetical protein